MGLLELLSDLLVEIWSYLTARDIVRFGMVCKGAEKVSWPAVRDLTVRHPNLLDYVLSRDLSHIRKLDVYLENDNPLIGSVDLVKYGQTLQKFENLADAATNLTSLVLALAIGYKIPEHDVVVDTVAKLTNLSALHLAFEMNQEDTAFDLGAAFNNHRALTRLGLYFSTVCSNFSQLTQLKTLDLDQSSFRKDGPLIEISTSLTNLREFIIGDMELVDPENIDILSSLTNLEAVRVSDCHSLKFLLHLPKLTELAVYGENRDDAEDVNIIHRLTNLTTLSYMTRTNPSGFRVSTLPNLQTFGFYGHIETMDFSNMKNLTSLTIYPYQNTYKITNLPPNIQYLWIPTTFVHNNDLETICNCTSLTTLNVREIETKELSSLSKLVNLESFGINRIRPVYLDPLRLYFPNLKYLFAINLDLDTLPEIRTLTRLCSFQFSNWPPGEEKQPLHNGPFPISCNYDEQCQ